MIGSPMLPFLMNGHLISSPVPSNLIAQETFGNQNINVVNRGFPSMLTQRDHANNIVIPSFLPMALSVASPNYYIMAQSSTPIVNGISQSLASPNMSAYSTSPKTPSSKNRSSSMISNSPTTTPTGRNNKAGWYSIHEKHCSKLKLMKPSILLCGDSIVAGLTRYPQVWTNYLRPLRAFNMGIGGDKTQHVLWRVENITIPDSVKIALIHCGTNNIGSDSPENIAKGIISIGLAMQEKKPNLQIIVTGLLPRDLKPSIRRTSISQVNAYLKDYCENKLTGFYVLNQDTDWMLEDGTLNESLYFSDHLHLVEKGNLKFAQAILKTVNIVERERPKNNINNPSNNNLANFVRQHGQQRTPDKSVIVYSPLQQNNVISSPIISDDSPQMKKENHSIKRRLCENYTNEKNNNNDDNELIKRKRICLDSAANKDVVVVKSLPWQIDINESKFDFNVMEHWLLFY